MKKFFANDSFYRYLPIWLILPFVFSLPLISMRCADNAIGRPSGNINLSIMAQQTPKSDDAMLPADFPKEEWAKIRQFASYMHERMANITNLAVYDFVNEAEKEPDEGGIVLAELFEKAFANYKDVRILSRREMDVLLKNAHLELLDIFDQNHLSSLGSLPKADALLTGKYRIQSQNLLLTLHLIQATTSVRIADADLKLKKTILDYYIDPKQQAISQQKLIGQLMALPENQYRTALDLMEKINAANQFTLKSNGLIDKFNKRYHICIQSKLSAEQIDSLEKKYPHQPDRLKEIIKERVQDEQMQLFHACSYLATRAAGLKMNIAIKDENGWEEKSIQGEIKVWIAGLKLLQKKTFYENLFNKQVPVVFAVFSWNGWLRPLDND